MDTQWTLLGYKVNHPVLVCMAQVGTVIGLMFVVIMSPILIPIHHILKAFGRRGFWYNKNLTIGISSFWRR